MKYRMGFVSNSSSSSFCIYGANFDGLDDIRSRLTEYGIQALLARGYNIYEMDDSYEFEEFVSTNLELETFEYGGLYFGKSWAQIGDNETGKQFKDSIQTIIDTWFKDTQCYTYEEAYYNG